MNHRHAENSNLADRYLTGKLSYDEQCRFEEHYIDCPECIDRLETTAQFRRALKSAAAEDLLRPSAYVRATAPSRNAPPRRWGRAALLLAALVLAALPTVHFAWQAKRISGELERERAISADWQRKFAENRQAPDGREKDFRGSEENLARQPREDEPRPRDVKRAREPAGPMPQNKRDSRAVPPVFALHLVRGGANDSAPPNNILIPRSAGRIVLSLETGADPDVRAYRVKILNQSDDVVWGGENLRPRSGDALRVVLKSDLLKAGDYSLDLEGLTREGSYVPDGRYSFRVLESN